MIASPVISPAGAVVQVAAVVWDATGTHRLQQKIDAIDKAGRELVRLEGESLQKLNVQERLKLLEEKIISFTRELMHFDHFMIRLLDRKSNAVWTNFAFPTWWHYDVLRGLDYLRRAGVTPDERVAEAIDLVVSKRDDDGRWPLEMRYTGQMPVEIDEGEGRSSRWNTLRALRVLDWYAARD